MNNEQHISYMSTMKSDILINKAVKLIVLNLKFQKYFGSLVANNTDCQIDLFLYSGTPLERPP